MSLTCRRCSHTRDAHEHFRAGSDCASCNCPHFRIDVIDAVTHGLRRKRPVPVLVPVDSEHHAPAA